MMLTIPEPPPFCFFGVQSWCILQEVFPDEPQTIPPLAFLVISICSSPLLRKQSSRTIVVYSTTEFTKEQTLLDFLLRETLAWPSVGHFLYEHFVHGWSNTAATHKSIFRSRKLQSLKLCKVLHLIALTVLVTQSKTTTLEERRTSYQLFWSSPHPS